MRLILTAFTYILVSMSISLTLAIKAADGQEESVQVIRAEGVGTILNHDIAHARDAAINDALRKAVEQGVGVIVEANTITENYFAIEDNIYTKARGFVAGYTPVSEKTEGNLIKVALDVRVSSGKIIDKLIDLNFIHSFAHKPRIMVMIPEQHLQRVIPDPAGETEVIRKFVEKDFWVVDQNQVKQIRQNDMAKRAAQGDNDAAAALGRQFQADIIIVGEGFSQVAETEGLGGLISCRARLEARAIRVDTGRIIAAHGIHAPGLELTEELASKKSLAQAGGKVADYMIGEIIRKWVLSVSQGTSVTLKLTNVTFKQLASLEKAMREQIRSVQQFHRRHFDLAGKIAEIEIDLKGDSQQFSTDLALTEFPDFEVEVLNLTPQTLDVRFIPKARQERINLPHSEEGNVTTPVRHGERQEDISVQHEEIAFIKTYALLVGVNEYDHHPNLINPVGDVEAVEKEIREVYRCETTILRNPTRQAFLTALYQLADRAYAPDDQLLVFFSGHGWFDERLKRGYLALRDSQTLAVDRLRDTFVSHEDVRTTLERLDCRHVLLVVDSCFSGTLDPVLAMAPQSRPIDDSYTPVPPAEFIRRKLVHQTRRYITAGGAEYVPDGRPGHHSPFARQLLQALRSYGGSDSILTYEEMLLHLEKVDPQPRTGELFGNEPGSSFVLIAYPPAENEKYGELTVYITPADAQVTVQRLDSPAQDPVRALVVEPVEPGKHHFRVPVGRYRIQIALSGYRTATRDVDVGAEVQTITITLSPER